LTNALDYDIIIVHQPYILYIDFKKYYERKTYQISVSAKQNKGALSPNAPAFLKGVKIK
jgi:hypothetical protein